MKKLLLTLGAAASVAAPVAAVVACSSDATFNAREELSSFKANSAKLVTANSEIANAIALSDENALALDENVKKNFPSTATATKSKDLKVVVKVMDKGFIFKELVGTTTVIRWSSSNSDAAKVAFEKEFKWDTKFDDKGFKFTPVDPTKPVILYQDATTPVIDVFEDINKFTKTMAKSTTVTKVDFTTSVIAKVTAAIA